MSDWLFTTLPIAVVVYFLLNPEQFTFVVNWAGGLLH
jgi:hypothetical protein